MAETSSANLRLSCRTVGMDGIDALCNALLDREPAPTNLVSAEACLAAGGTLTGLQAQLAHSAELQ